MSSPVDGGLRLHQMGLMERATRRLPDLIREAAETSDFVVLDTPALTEVSDGLRILPSADQLVLVARLRHTKRAALSRCGDLLARAGRAPLGIALTGAGGIERYETALAGARTVPGRAMASGSDEEPLHSPAAPR
jgi:Mrp family chromosome partitioning ATPase